MMKVVGRFAAIAAVCLGANGAIAETVFERLTNPGPEPTDNRAVALSQGRQISGYGGKCIDADGDMRAGVLLAMRDCDANSVHQRFKFENNHLKTSLRLPNAPNGWVTMCVTAVAEERLALVPCTGEGGVGLMGSLGPSISQQWRINGSEIQRLDGAECFDFYRSLTDNGTPILHYRCNGGANQNWGWH